MVVKSRREKGIGLILALLLLAMLSMLVAAMLSAIVVEVRIADTYRADSQLVYLTESGIEEGREALRSASMEPSPLPFIEDRTLRFEDGREAGRYSVSLIRSLPPTLRSTGTIGEMRKALEARLRKTGFPPFPDAITLNEDVPPPGVGDPQLQTTVGLEAVVEGISRHATEVFNPVPGEAVSLGVVGSPSDYRVVVVNGDCVFGNATGYGLLLVRGELMFMSTFSWNGLVAVVGQGVVRGTESTGFISGGLFLSRTRADDRTASNPLGTLLERRGAVTLELPPGPVTVSLDAEEMRRANERFPYVVTAYREF